MPFPVENASEGVPPPQLTLISNAMLSLTKEGRIRGRPVLQLKDEEMQLDLEDEAAYEELEQLEEVKGQTVARHTYFSQAVPRPKKKWTPRVKELLHVHDMQPLRRGADEVQHITLGGNRHKVGTIIEVHFDTVFMGNALDIYHKDQERVRQEERKKKENAKEFYKKMMGDQHNRK